MRMLHTSDWHIGRQFESEDLSSDQRSFVAWLISQYHEHHVDLLVVAGDIWDRSQPSGEAVTQLGDALDDLESAGVNAVIIPGNHDSAIRLGFRGTRKGDGFGIRIFADDLSYPSAHLFEAGGERVTLLPIPFLDPGRFLEPLPNSDGTRRPRTHENALIDALAAGREAAVQLGDHPIIVVAHAYVAGAMISDSERRTIGTADLVNASIFDGFTYVALGHLHRPQDVGGNPRIAYSGSPLPYSFSEDGPKSVRLVDLTPDGEVSVKLLPIPIGRPVKVLQDSLANLLDLEDYTPFTDHWVSAKLTDTEAQDQPKERLRRRFPFVASVSYANLNRGMSVSALEELGDADDLTPRDIVAAFLAESLGRDPSPSEVATIENLLGSAEAALR